MKSILRAGIPLALVTAFISGVSIYVNKFAVQAVDDSLLFTTLKNTLVGLALVTYAGAYGARAASASLSLRQPAGRWRWIGLCSLAVVGGSLPFLVFFEGLARAAAPGAALIHKSLFLWVALLAAPLLGERPGGWTLVGLGLLAAGQLLKGSPRAWGWGSGESLILLATLLWAVETILARRLLAALPVSLAASARMAGGAIAMWLYLFAIGRADGVRSLSAVQWGWIALTSALLFGYVTMWYAALKRAPATVVTSILTLGAVITAGLSLALERQVVAWEQTAGLALMMVGAALVIGLSLPRRQDVRAAA